MEKDTSTELKIKEAATRVFIAKGFNGCTSREIAKEAGMNVALVNYYFKSKSHLFEIVIASVIEKFAESLFEVFKSELPLVSKVRVFIEKEYDFLGKHPEIASFLINELSKQEANFFQCVGFSDAMKDAKIEAQVKEAQEKGEMRKINLVNIILLLMSNTNFPFIARPMIQSIHSINDENYKTHLILHKQYVIDMLINYLFPNSKEF
jgi:AcrR family transcriptional regulator